MRQLGMYAAVLVVTGTGLAHATPWSEYAVAQPPRPAEQLVETGCDISVELRGAIAEVELRQKLSNPGPAALAAMTELVLPPGAQLIGMSLQRGRGKSEVAIPITNVAPNVERVTSSQVLGADPVLLHSLPLDDDNRPRFRALVQPLDVDQEITLETRWTAVASIRGGALHLLLPGRGAGAQPCRGLAQVTPGPGATVERMRLDGVELGARSTASFELGAGDATLTAALAFKRSEPIAWVQTQALGDGYTARATTLVAPSVKSSDSRRALFVIDGSRSMELVGRHNVKRIINAIGTALPQKAEVEAVIFDRAQARVLGGWKPANAATIAAIEAAVGTHTATNGSDTAGALAYARTLTADLRGQTLVIMITDGVLGDVTRDNLTKALAAAPSELDLHAFVLVPGRMDPPDASTLRAVVGHFGGSYTEVASKDVDDAIAGVDSWLRPAWHELALAGNAAPAVPVQLRAGTGTTVFDLVKQAGKLTLTGHGAKPFSTTAARGPKAQLAQLALALPGVDDESVRASLRERHIAVTEDRQLVVLSSTGSVAANRRAMIVGGGPYTRMVEVEDPPAPAFRPPPPPQIILGVSALDRTTLTVLLKQYLQPAAFTCYQRALGHDNALAGTARFTLEIGRGEVTSAQVNGLANATFAACLVDAAYQVTPPLPNPDFNVDDRTIVNYPLTFSIREQKPFIVAGDADSSAPIDIDAVQGGPPIASPRRPIKAGDTSTPLGGLRPSPTK